MTDPTATPATPATLRELLERVKSATGADRETDVVVWLALTPGATRETRHVNHWKTPYVIDETRDATGRLVVIPEYTASLDAALALVERALPGVHWSVTNAAIKPRASVWVPSPLRAYGLRHQSAATPALALLAAMLEAKIMEAENG